MGNDAVNGLRPYSFEQRGAACLKQGASQWEPFLLPFMGASQGTILCWGYMGAPDCEKESKQPPISTLLPFQKLWVLVVVNSFQSYSRKQRCLLNKGRGWKELDLRA